MASQSVARSESIAAFIPALELLITEAMDEWKIPGLAIAVVQNGEVTLVRAYGLRDVEAGLKVTTDTQFLIGSVTNCVSVVDRKSTRLNSRHQIISYAV